MISRTAGAEASNVQGVGMVARIPDGTSVFFSLYTVCGAHGIVVVARRIALARRAVHVVMGRLKIVVVVARGRRVGIWWIYTVVMTARAVGRCIWRVDAVLVCSG